MHVWCTCAQNWKKKEKKKENLTPESLCIAEGHTKFDSYVNQDHQFCWHFHNWWDYLSKKVVWDLPVRTSRDTSGPEYRSMETYRKCSYDI